MMISLSKRTRSPKNKPHARDQAGVRRGESVFGGYWLPHIDRGPLKAPRRLLASSLRYPYNGNGHERAIVRPVRLPQSGEDSGRTNMTQSLSRLWFQENGQDVAEYSVMLAVVLIIALATIRMIGSSANAVFSSIGSAIQ
jgi:Flp pilus assembly pilin Flp